MSEQPHEGSASATQFERWQQEQREWQRLVTSYIDTAATDQAFLTSLGNALRGSLLAGKPYPGTGAPASSAAQADSSERIDEVVFGLRRVEGRLEELTMALDELTKALRMSTDGSGR